jgi:hypothetical protein
MCVAALWGLLGLIFFTKFLEMPPLEIQFVEAARELSLQIVDL